MYNLHDPNNTIYYVVYSNIDNYVCDIVPPDAHLISGNEFLISDTNVDTVIEQAASVGITITVDDFDDNIIKQED